MMYPTAQIHPATQPPTPVHRQGRTRSRASTINLGSSSGKRSPSLSSVDGDDDDDDGPFGRFGGYSTESRRTSPDKYISATRSSIGSMDALNGAASHQNEIQAEYRADVDRIFYAYLNRICSNRK